MIIENAFVLATTTFMGGYLIWRKLPVVLRRWLCNAPLVTDVVLFLVAYVVLGTSTTALLASAVLGLFVSGALTLSKHAPIFNRRWPIDLEVELAWR